MIASLRGTVLRVSASSLVLDVAGVGYFVTVTPEHALSLRTGQEAFVLTQLVVREDAFALYGFRTEEEIEAFEMLQNVRGIGPKSALGVLSQMTPEALARAVQDEDVAAFKRVSGIGPKTAQLVILELAGKLAHLSVGSATDDAGGVAHDSTALSAAKRADVTEALVGLGYAAKQAEGVIDDAVAALSEATDTQTELAVADVLRASLRLLGPGSAGSHARPGASRR